MTRPWRKFGNTKTAGESNGESREVVRELSVMWLPDSSCFCDPLLGIFFGWMVTGFEVDHGRRRHTIRIYLAMPRRMFNATYDGKPVYRKVSWKHSIRLLWWLLRSKAVEPK